MQRYLPIAVAVIVLVVSAVVQGVWSERWGTFPELTLFADQLPKVPMQMGEWKAEKTDKTDDRIMAVAGAVGSLSRTYKNAEGDSVLMMLVCGRLQDVFYHTPDRCYPAAGFSMGGEPKKEIIEAGSTNAEFYNTTFLKSETSSGTQNVRVYWSWCASGPWEAPETPKVAYRGKRALYKLYVSATEVQGAQVTDDSPSVQFIKVLIPELDKALEPATSTAREAYNETPKSSDAKAEKEPKKAGGKNAEKKAA